MGKLLLFCVIQIIGIIAIIGCLIFILMTVKDKSGFCTKSAFGVKNKEAFQSNKLTSTLIDLIYPVGSVYITFTKEPPEIGTWELIETDKFLRSTQYASGKTGGSDKHKHATADHVLTIDEMPKHTHKMQHRGYRTCDGKEKKCVSVEIIEDDPIDDLGNTDTTGGDKPHNHGDTEDSSSLPSYLSVFMYKRTA